MQRFDGPQFGHPCYITFMRRFNDHTLSTISSILVESFCCWDTRVTFNDRYLLNLFITCSV